MADSGLESPQSPSVPPTPDSSSTAAGPSTPPKPPTPANPSTPASPPTPASSSTPPNPPSGAPKPPGPLNLQARPPSLPESLLSSLPEGGLLFSGWYTQRVWVQECQSYRDQIQVDDGETEARRVIKSMMRKCKKESVFPSVQRVGETVSLLVNWPSGSQPFGHYWFQLHLGPKASVLSPHGVVWIVKVVRSVLQSDSQGSGKCPHCNKFPSDPDSSNNNGDGSAPDDPLNLSDIANRLQQKFRDYVNPMDWYEEARPHLTLGNIVHVFKFILILGMALISGLANLMPQMLSILNRTIHELAFVIHRATPLALACLDVVNKAIGGFYLLLTMIWKDSRKPSEPSPPPSTRLQALENRSTFLRHDGGLQQPRYRQPIQRPYIQS